MKNDAHENYSAAAKLIAKHQNLASFVGPRTDSLIEKAEKYLKVKFPPSYRAFLKEFGAGSFGSTSIEGLHDAKWQGFRTDAVWLTQDIRDGGGFADHLIAVHQFGDGEVFCLDLSRSAKNGEAPVVAVTPGAAEDTSDADEIAPDFGTFLLNTVREEIDANK